MANCNTIYFVYSTSLNIFGICWDLLEESTYYGSISYSEEQGFGNTCRYTGKGLEGMGEGMECLTPHKPLPVTEGRGIPSLLLAGKSHDVCGHLPHHKHGINKQMLPFSTTTFITTHCVTTFATTTTSGNHHSTTPPPPLHTSMMMAVWQCHITAPYAHCFRWPGMSDVPCCLDGDDACCRPHVTQCEQPDMPPPPFYSHKK